MSFRDEAKPQPPEEPDSSEVLASRTATGGGLIAYYNLIYRSAGFKVPPHLVPVCYALMDDRIRNLMLIVGPGSGKFSPYNSQVPTPTGERRWGDLYAGDLLFGKDGCATTILARHEQGVVPIYRVSFDDGTSTLCGLEHNWTVRGRRERKRKAWTGVAPFVTLTTKEILARGVRYKDNSDPKGYRKNFEIPVYSAVQYPRKPVPFDAYAVGVWLGDGLVRTGSFTKPDVEISERLSKKGISCTRKDYSPRCPIWKVHGLRQALKTLGLFEKRCWEKSVPNIYKENSPDIRLDVLRGLMDTDGTPTDGGTATFTSTSKQLAEDVCWLVRSLGGKAMIAPKHKYFTLHGCKKRGRSSFDVNIVLPGTTNPFSLGRKADIYVGDVQNRYLTRWITDIEYSHDEQAMCVTVAADDGLYLCNDFIVTHNSNLLTVAYPTHLLGRRPAETVLAISAGEKLVQGFAHASTRIIEHSPEYRKVFPNVMPDKSAGWSTHGYYVTGHIPGNSDSSLFVCGTDSSALTGKHATTLILDDIHDKGNSATSDHCDKVVAAYYSTIIGRADPRGARFIIAGRRWHTNDIYGELIRSGDYVVMTLPAERKDETQLFWDIDIPDGLVCCFNEKKNAAKN